MHKAVWMVVALPLLTCSAKMPATPSGSISAPKLVDAFPNLTFANPVFLTSGGDGSGRLFVVEQAGVIRVFANDSAAASSATFLDIRDRVASGGEMGLLGLAFHPDFDQNGLFYVDYTTGSSSAPRTVISEFSASGNSADVASERFLLQVDQVAPNHNGGMIAFGADGFLYIGLGDGGGANDPGRNGQNKGTLLGSILRIDVDNKDANLEYAIPTDNPFVGDGNGVREEIFAYGLRNPWRFSLDAPTGDLWVGDVGQNRREEIDLVLSGGNYGWPRMEGFDCFDPSRPNNPPANCDQTGLLLPAKDYSHALGCSVTGGYVYRGSRRPELVGAYIYGDFCSGTIWLLRMVGGSVVVDSALVKSSLSISSFGVDGQNELYILDLAGKIYRFQGMPTTRVGSDNKLPRVFRLRQNYPNPFNPATRISYTLTQVGKVTVAVFNSLGQKVRTLVNRFQPAGVHETSWDGRTEDGALVSSGWYLYQLESRGQAQARNMLMVR